MEKNEPIFLLLNTIQSLLKSIVETLNTSALPFGALCKMLVPLAEELTSHDKEVRERLLQLLTSSPSSIHIETPEVHITTPHVTSSPEEERVLQPSDFNGWFKAVFRGFGTKKGQYTAPHDYAEDLCRDILSLSSEIEKARVVFLIYQSPYLSEGKRTKNFTLFAGNMCQLIGIPMKNYYKRQRLAKGCEQLLDKFYYLESKI